MPRPNESSAETVPEIEVSGIGFPKVFTSNSPPVMFPLLTVNTPPNAIGALLRSTPLIVKAYPPLTALGSTCRSRLPLEVAVPSNCVISACFALTNWMANCSVPVPPTFALFVISVSVPCPVVPSTANVPPVMLSPDGCEVIPNASL